MYEYQATLETVTDGDTIVVSIDLGFGVWIRKQSLRLLGINAPEMSTEEGKKSQAALLGFLEGKKLVIRTAKDKKEKWGRWLATVLADSVPANVWLVENGFAAIKSY